MAIIEFENVSKTYHLGAGRTSLREAVTNIPQQLFRRNGTHEDKQLFWALKDVSFKVEQGEVLGIIGHNGAGKSTTLKLLSKVAFPSSGRIHTRGRMAALIELGAGFHPDLSGRENIYLNGSILGLKRREIDAQFSNMVEFAGLEKFIDTPVKRYSSGMYVRLAFAVAAHVKADLLLIDEVLSVGDMAFQQRCLNKMNELRDSGATIVFISHNLWSVSTFCNRVILLQGGQIKAEDTPDKVVELYRTQERENQLIKTNKEDASILGAKNGQTQPDAEVVITKIELLNEAGQPVEEVDPYEDRLLVRIHYSSPQPIERPGFGIQIHRSDGLLCCDLFERVEDVRPIHGQGAIQALIGPLQLVPDYYSVEVKVIDRRQSTVYAVGSAGKFRVKGWLESSTPVGVCEPKIEYQTITA